MSRMTFKQWQDIQESLKLRNNLHIDRDKQINELIRYYIWEKTSPFTYYSVHEEEINKKIEKLSEEFSKEYNDYALYIEDFWGSIYEEDDKADNIKNIEKLLNGLDSREIEYVRYKIIQQIRIPGCEPYLKNINYRSDETLKVLELLEKTEIGNYYPIFKDVFSSEEYRKKCFTENYLDNSVLAGNDPANFKAFIDKLFSLYGQLEELDKDNAEKAFIDTIDSALKMQTPCLLICCKEKYSNNISVKAVFFAKDDEFKFYKLNNNSTFIKKNDENNKYLLINIYQTDYELKSDIQKLIDDIYVSKKVAKYPNLLNKLLKCLIKQRILVKKSKADRLCNVCNKQSSEKHYKNQSACITCQKMIEYLVEDYFNKNNKTIKIQSLHKRLKQAKNEPTEKWRKRQHRYIIKNSINPDYCNNWIEENLT